MKERLRRFPGGILALVLGSLSLVVALTGTAVATTGLVTIAGPSGAKAGVTSVGSLVTSERDPSSKHFARVNSSGQTLVSGPVTSADRSVVVASGTIDVPGTGAVPDLNQALTSTFSTAGYRAVRVEVGALNTAAGDRVKAFTSSAQNMFMLDSWQYSNVGEAASNASHVSQVVDLPGPNMLLLFTNTSGADEHVYWQVVGRRN